MATPDCQRAVPSPFANSDKSSPLSLVMEIGHIQFFFHRCQVKIEVRCQQKSIPFRCGQHGGVCQSQAHKFAALCRARAFDIPFLKLLHQLRKGDEQFSPDWIADVRKQIRSFGEYIWRNNYCRFTDQFEQKIVVCFGICGSQSLVLRDARGGNRSNDKQQEQLTIDQSGRHF